MWTWHNIWGTQLQCWKYQEPETSEKCCERKNYWSENLCPVSINPYSSETSFKNRIRSWRLMWQGCHYYCDGINSWWMNGEKVSVKVLKNNLPIKIFWKINSNIFNYKVECSTDAQLLTLSTSNRNGALSIFFLILHIDRVALSRRGSCHLESWNRSSDTLALTTTTWICFLGTH